jgi:hypothetical protein
LRRLKTIEVFEEEKPRGLLGVVELGATTGFLTKAVIDHPERLFKGAAGFPITGTGRR